MNQKNIQMMKRRKWRGPWRKSPCYSWTKQGKPHYFVYGQMWIRCFEGGYRYFYAGTGEVGENIHYELYYKQERPEEKRETLNDRLGRARQRTSRSGR